MSKRQDFAKRFWAKVRKSDGCWEWTGFVNPKGYGYFKLNGRMERAHRVSYWLATGQWPQELFVCHRCDNRRCVRPDHLFLGNNAENMADAAAKGRIPDHGPRPKLDIDAVLSIRNRVAAGCPLDILAAQYGVRELTIKRVAARETWSYI